MVSSTGLLLALPTRFEGPAFGGLVVGVYLLAFVCGVALLVPPVAGMDILSPRYFVVDGLAAEAQLFRNSGDWNFCF